MTLCGEIDYPASSYQIPRPKDIHLTRHNQSILASTGILPEILWISIFKLKRNAPPHNANTIHSIDQSLALILKHIPVCILYHKSPPQKYHSG